MQPGAIAGSGLDGVAEGVAEVEQRPRAGFTLVLGDDARLELAAAQHRMDERHVEALAAREPPALIYAVRRSCELKARIVAADERESGARALLNFGHTFGHAIEAASGYGAWLHGEAIAAGMVMASELSARLGGLQSSDVKRVRQLLSRAGLPLTGPALAPEKLMGLMALDKKAAKGRTRFVLLEAIGRAALRADVDDAAARQAIVAAAQQR